MRRGFFIFSFLACALIIGLGFLNPKAYWAFIVIGPIVVQGMIDAFDRKHSIISNFPLFGRFRYVMEVLRPKIYQYFIESDTDGTPISRIFRSVVYQRAKQDNSSTPFGTQLDVYQPGYEWINHSLSPLPLNSIKVNDLRVQVGGQDCKKPYSASIFNISAMSYGALSKNAIEALNKGAKLGNFAHNTGEGGISPFHLKHGGDLIWQVGTGYFGCRDENGNFSEELFIQNATLPSIKMIEIKLSQGAKPGHGGILPAAKNTPEIAKIRRVKPYTRVDSPSKHTAFDGPEGLLQFVKKLRDLSGGKPIGFKLCFGIPEEFEDICRAMIKLDILPDYISIDGGEGGTGAAPLEFSNSVGMPLRDGLVFAVDLLNNYGLKNKIKVMVGGKILTGFEIIKYMALGADLCYSARGMMLALGCIQALVCNKNECPTGVATQDPQLMHGLNVEDKYKRIRNYHHSTIESVAELLAAAGIRHTSELRRKHIWRRISQTETKSYDQLFPAKSVLKAS